ncbi:protein PFF0380w-like [Frieseomelitta varia]|uniref:protein PFF0380w-like n=1 Tax=Frieseomelitta varia TaxID=561572 RepID=UPI001CB69DC2|nr:protein PFF0380w-like [Frieseomelitta varia]
MDLQKKVKNSNKDINYDRIIEVVDLETIQNLSKDNLFLNECSENKNIVFLHTITSPKIIEEKDDITHTAKKNSYKNTDLTNKKCIVTDQNDDNNNNVKKRKLNRNFGSISYNENVENTSKYLKEEKHEIKTCRIINEKVCDSLQNVQLCESTVSEMNGSLMKNQFLVDKENLNKEEAEDSDCLSLFADSTLMQEYNTYLDDNSEKSFQMTDNVIENYYKNTTSDFNKFYNNNDDNNNENNVTSDQKYNTVLQKSLQNPQIATSRNINAFKSIFHGFCYYTIMYNKCLRNDCRFRHDFIPTMINWYSHKEEYFFKILDELVFNNFTEFVRNFYLQALPVYSQYDIQCILKILKKLYKLKAVNGDTVFYTIDYLKQRYSIKVITHEISIIVNNSDFEFVNCVLKQLCSKEYIMYGEYWNTLKNLLLRIENLDPKIVETILQECIITRTHIEEVNFNIMRKLTHQVRCKINNDVLLSFKNLIKEKTQKVDKNKQVKDNGISSPDSCCMINELEMDERMNILNTTETVERINENSSFKLHLIDNLAKPQSARIRFWKFYIDVHKLHEGLKRNDYDYVMNILNSVKEEQQTFFTRATYQILCNEIRYSHYHFKKLILHSVRTGVTATCYQILFDTVKYALVTLAEKNLWVLANILLEDINITQMYFHKIDAATIMLIAEIYLANHLAIKAFFLLKQTNIIYTDPHKWKVHYTAKDISIRVQIITILLNALCETFLEYAFYLFQFLVVDQYSNFYPIDITNFVNKAVPMLLSEKNYFLIIHIAKLIINYNFIPNTITYRALIATLIHIDMALTKRLYQTGIGLGIYSRIQLCPTIHLIINTDWTKEEMYLAVLDSIEQLSLHIGYGIDHIKQNDFSIYLNFENVPLHKKYTHNKRMYQHKIAKSKILMKNVLKKQFNPPILMAKRKTDKICKLNTLSVLNYLKHKAKQ